MKMTRKKHKGKSSSIKKIKRPASSQKISPPKPSPEACGLLLFAFSIFMILSMFSMAYSTEMDNILGLVGHAIASFLFTIFGVSSYILAGFFGWIGWRLLFTKSINHPELKSCYIIGAMFSLSMLLSWLEHDFISANILLNELFYPSLWEQGYEYNIGGTPIYYLYYDLPKWNMLRILNSVGVAIIFSSTLTACVMFLAKVHPYRLLDLLKALCIKAKSWISLHRRLHPTKVVSEHEDSTRFVTVKTGVNSHSQDDRAPASNEQDLLAIKPEKLLTFRPSLSRKNEDDKSTPEQMKTKDPIKDTAKASEALTKRQAALNAQSIHNGDFRHYKLPQPSLLTAPKMVDQSSLKQGLRRHAEVLEETLLSFGIEAKVGQINCGPTINSFEVHPAIGVKVQKIKALENDIALNMEAKSIRIIAPIPGKAAVGIEVPNPNPQEVAFKDLLIAYQKSGRQFHIPILLGKSVNGDYVMSDLTKMPHCIIAGATGSGKSVCINTIIMSILMNTKPDEVRLIMVDPKKVELTPYSPLPHMLAPVITEPHGAYAAVQWLVKEMENRYELLKQMGLRNINAFNSRTVNKQVEEALDIEIPEKLPYIVAIFDELADLMMVSSNDIETPIARIAQMARAVGIHLILATQRPSREVITGIIKANFPTRISFKVASRVNSQIVLDETGAESLLGNGDMLFLPPGSSHLVRAQGAFISDEDINQIISTICQQAPPNYIIDSFDQSNRRFTLGGDEDLFTDMELDSANSKDSLFADACDIVLKTGNASTTFLQRKLKIGYARAASLMDEMESQGIVGPAEGSRARKILVNKSKSEEPEEGLLAETYDKE